MADCRCLTTDGVVLTEQDEVLLLERDHAPHEGYWVLPGGYVEPDETAREACRREVREETGLEVAVGEFLGLYDAPDRDPRGTAAAAYLCRSEDPAAARPVEEATAVDTFPLDALPELGFDHAMILADVRER